VTGADAPDVVVEPIAGVVVGDPVTAEPVVALVVAATM
jgi:hypothetical protein